MQALDSLRDNALTHLPGWVPWAAPLAWIFATFVVTWVVCTIADRQSVRPYLKARPEHWTEAARLLFPARRSALAMVLLCTGLPIALILEVHGPLTPLSMRWFGALVGLAGFAGSFLGLGRAEHIVHGGKDTLSARLRTVAMSYLIFYSSLPVFALALLAMPRYWGTEALVVLVGSIALHQLLVRSGSEWTLRRLGVLRDASPELNAMVEELADSTGATRPPVYELRVLQANAMVIPQTKTIFVTEAMLDTLSPAEVRAVLAHEFGHLLESKKVTNLRTLRGSLILFLAAVFPVFHSFGIMYALLAAVLPVALALLSARLIRDLETQADEVGKAHEGEPGTYARALEGLYRRNLMPAVMPGSGKTHPHLYDRMLAADYEPDYPRPEPPPAHALKSAPFLAIIVLVTSGMIAHEVHHGIEGRVWEEGTGYASAVAASGGHPWQLFAMAEHWLDATAESPPELEPVSGATREEAAWDLLNFASAVSNDAYLHIRFAEECVATRRNDEARQALENSRKHVREWNRTSSAAERGLVYLDLGDADGVATELATLEAAAPEETEDDAWTSVKAAFLHRSRGQRERADQWLAKARAIAEREGYIDSLESYVADLKAEEAER